MYFRSLKQWATFREHIYFVKIFGNFWIVWGVIRWTSINCPGPPPKNNIYIKLSDHCVRSSTLSWSIYADISGCRKWKKIWIAKLRITLRLLEDRRSRTWTESQVSRSIFCQPSFSRLRKWPKIHFSFQQGNHVKGEDYYFSGITPTPLPPDPWPFFLMIIEADSLKKTFRPINRRNVRNFLNFIRRLLQIWYVHVFKEKNAITLIWF
jgi:hypothetical protein